MEVEESFNFFSKLNLILPVITLIIGSYLGYIMGVVRDRKKTAFDKKLEIYSGLIKDIGGHFSKDRTSNNLTEILAYKLSAARLLSEEKLEKELRNYYDYKAIERDSTDIDKKQKAINLSMISTMKIEQLMREELGQKRVLTDKEIEKHILLKTKT